MIKYDSLDNLNGQALAWCNKVNKVYIGLQQSGRWLLSLFIFI